MNVVSLSVLALLGLLFALWLRRATELFALRVRGGRVRFVRGRLPPSLLRDLRDVLVQAGVEGELRVVVERDVARVVAKGDFDPGTLQRVRNVVGNVPIARIRAGRKPSG